MEDGMTVADLRKAIEGLPDDMVIVTYDYGRLDMDFTGTQIIEGGAEFPCGEAGKKYLLIY